MHIDPPVRELDIRTDQELLDFDILKIKEEHWGETRGKYPNFYDDVDSFRVLKAPADEILNMKTTKDSEITYVHEDHPIFPVIMKQVRKIEEHLDATAIMVALNRMAPDSWIPPHFDSKMWNHTYRIHVPLVSDPIVQFTFNYKKYHFEVGKIYEMDNTIEHSVTNRSNVWRVHMLLDLVPNDRTKDWSPPVD